MAQPNAIFVSFSKLYVQPVFTMLTPSAPIVRPAALRNVCIGAHFVERTA